VLQRRASGARSPSGSSTSGRPWRSPTRTGRVSRRSRRAAPSSCGAAPWPFSCSRPVERRRRGRRTSRPPGRRSPHASSSRRPPPPKVTARRQG
jgi:hypothetical protein